MNKTYLFIGSKFSKNLKKGFSVILTAMLVVSGFFVANFALAAHTATVTVDPTIVDGGFSDTFTFIITNDASSANFIYKIEITTPSGFVIGNNLSCPSGGGWILQSIEGNTATCAADSFDGPGIQVGAQGVISFIATAPGIDSTEPWLVKTRDSLGVWQTYNPVTIVDATAPSITAPADIIDCEATGLLSEIDLGDPVVSDNFDPAPVITNDAPVSFPLGITVITWIATDAAGNSNTAIQEVTVVDTIAPQITVPATQTFEATGFETIPTLIEATAVDIVDPSPTITYIPQSFTVGTHMVTWTARDASGNESIATSEVIITDLTAPVIDSHEDVTEEATSPAGAVVTYTAPTSYDAVDGDLPAECSPVSGSQFTLEETTVTCTKTDANGNEATPVTFTVTVEDTTAPDITAPEDITQEANGPLSTVDDLGTPVVSDAVDGSPDVTNDAPASFLLGITVVTWTATDDAGNIATAEQNVTIVDTIDPVITPPIDQIFEATGSLTTPELVEATAVDIADPNPVITYDPHSFPVGDTTVTWTATDASGNTTETTSLITIQDTTAPIIEDHADMVEEATSPAGAVVTYTAPTSYDAVDGDLPAECSPVSGSQFTLEETTVTCTKTDTNGNEATSVIFTVTVVDTTAPTIDSHDNIAYVEATSPDGAEVIYTNPTSHDAVDGDLPSECLPVSGSTFALGETIVTCTKTDANGNEATPITFTVTVVDTTDPIITPPEDQIFEATGPETTPILIPATAEDIADPSPTITYDPQSFTLGTHTVTWTATDDSGNTAEITSQVTIQDTTAPEVNAGSDVITNSLLPQDATVVESGSGVASYSWVKVSGPGDITFGTPNAEDTIISANADGVYEIKLTVVDNASNSTFDTMQLTWDTTPPTIADFIAPVADTVYKTTVPLKFTPNDTGTAIACSYTIDGGSSIPVACTKGVAVDTTISGLTDDGRHSLTVTVSDAAGNSVESASVSFVIDTDDTLTVGLDTEDFDTIQEAVNKATPEDTINVSAGTYNEDVTINRSLTLIGAQVGVDARTRGTLESEIVGVVEVTSEVTNIVFDGFKFTSPTRDFSPRGFNLRIESESSTIQNNIFIAEENAGHTYSGYLDFEGITNTTVAQNTFSGDLDSIQEPNVIRLGISGAGTIIVDDNEMHDVGGGGGIGIMCTNAEAVINIENNEIDNTGDGIWLWSPETQFDTLTVDSNNIYNCQKKGIKVVGPVSGNIFISNNDIYNNCEGINTNQGSGIYVNYNKIYDNTCPLTGIQNNSEEELDAESNWWGTVTGPNHSTNPGGQGNAVSDNVDFRPWCSEEGCESIDEGSPYIISRIPGINVVGVSGGINIEIGFNENVQCGGEDWSDCFKLTWDDNGTPVTVVGTFPESDDNILIFTPNESLDSNILYTVALTNVIDQAGNYLIGQTSWSFTTATHYNISISNGWNLISLPTVPIDSGIENVLGDAANSINAVWTYDPVSYPSEPWRVYHPDSNLTSNLSKMTAGYGYWISATDNAEIEGYGSLFKEAQTPPSRRLVSGWNLISYYQRSGDNEAMWIGCALYTLLNNDYYPYWSMLEGYDNESKAFLDIGFNETVFPGQGFWILLKSSNINYIYGPGLSEEECYDWF